jgi:nitroreductase
MEPANACDFSELANTLMHSRQHVAPRRLLAPGPNVAQLASILATAAAAPDHGQLLPWRFVEVQLSSRALLADVFGQALIERDAQASAEQLLAARDKAHRAPCLMLAIARLCGSDVQREAERALAGELRVSDAERLVSLGCAIQNMLLSAHAMGFGSGLTSGQALSSTGLRQLFSLQNHEQAVCFVNIGSVSKIKPARLRPPATAFFSSL